MKAFPLLAGAALFGICAHAMPITPLQAITVMERSGAAVEPAEAIGSDAHRINVKIGEYNATVRLGNCDEEDRCSYAMMFATFNLGRTADEAVLTKTNHYNDSFPFGRAFVLKGNDETGDVVGVDYAIDISSDASFDATDLARFEEILAAFVDHWTAEE